MNVLSLFDGISTGRLALENANIKVEKYFAAEINQYAIQISNKNFQDITQLGDVTNIDINELPPISLLLGGSPCQGFSRNGLGLNFEDPRSKLFFTYVDILHKLREKNPNIYFLLENVVMKKEWQQVISKYLGVEPVEINSCSFIPQNRPRLYWTNIPFPNIPHKDIKLTDILQDPSIDYIDFKGLKVDSSINADCLNLVDVVNGEVRVKQAVKKGYIVANDGDGINLTFPKSKTRRGRVLNQKSGCIDTSGDLCVFYGNKIRKFTVNELELLQTLPLNYTEGIPNSERVKCIGNGWTTAVISHILGGMKNGSNY